VAADRFTSCIDAAAALHTVPWYESAEVLTALFTGGLLIVAIVTAVLGLQAARTVNDTYRLESAPVIVVNSTSVKVDRPERYVLTLDTSRKALQLRQQSYELDEPLKSPGVSMSPHFGGRPSWPQLTLELHNVGRSPAIYPRLYLFCNFSPASDLDYSKILAPPDKAKQPFSDPWTVGRDYPYILERADTLLGSVGTPVIAAGGRGFVSIENRVAADVEIRLRTPTNTRSNLATKIINGTKEPLVLRSMC